MEPTNLIQLTDYLRKTPEWGATFAVGPHGNLITGFHGTAELDVSERCTLFAKHLRMLAEDLELIAAACKADKQ